MSDNPDTLVGTVLDQANHDLDQACQRLFSLLRIPSTSTQPEHEPEVQQAAARLRDQLADLGFEVAVRTTAGHPVMLGSSLLARGRRVSCSTGITMCSCRIRSSFGRARRSTRRSSKAHTVRAAASTTRDSR